MVVVNRPIMSVANNKVPRRRRGVLRFSTISESKFFTQQGWEVINMTQYPEAILARELEILSNPAGWRILENWWGLGKLS